MIASQFPLFFVSVATHGLVFALLRCLERYNSASVQAILDELLHSFILLTYLQHSFVQLG